MRNKKIFYLLTLVAGSLFINCTGSDPEADPTGCGEFPAPAISSNSPVTAGNNIELEAPFISTMAEYYWTGPNGFVSHDQNPTVMASDATAGTYSLIVYEGSCMSDTATTTVAVTTAAAPCNPTNNTATTSSFPTLVFNSVYTATNTGEYEIRAGGSNGDVTITFKEETIPTPGVYSICATCPTSFLEPNQVCLSMVTGGTFSYLYRASAGQVYVSFVNGKITATYCNVSFSGGDPNMTFTSSAKMTDM